MTSDALDVAHERLHAAADDLDRNRDCGAENFFAYRDALLYAEWEFLTEVDVWLRERLEHAPQPVPHVEHPPASADGQQHGDDGEDV